jgi:hypothetical protein
MLQYFLRGDNNERGAVPDAMFRVFFGMNPKRLKGWLNGQKQIKLTQAHMHNKTLLERWR